MQHPRGRSPKSLVKLLAITAVTSATALSLAFPGGLALADPEPAPPPPPGLPLQPAPPLADPNAPPDSNGPPAPPEPGRVDNGSGGFSYLVPAGLKVSDITNLPYGQALLTKIPAAGTAQAPTGTSVLLGRLDPGLFAAAETDNVKAATRLASDMGKFFMPFPGTLTDPQAGPLPAAAGLPGAFSSYSVKFTDTTKPAGQIWVAVVGETSGSGTPRSQRTPERWFVVWLGSATSPVDKAAATTLAQSIRPFTPPPPPEAPPPDPNAPPTPVASEQRPDLGVPVPAQNAPPEMTPGG